MKLNTLFSVTALEEQYKQAKEEGVFEILRVLELDKEHSDRNLVQAIDYFNEKDGAKRARKNEQKTYYEEKNQG